MRWTYGIYGLVFLTLLSNSACRKKRGVSTTASAPEATAPNDNSANAAPVPEANTSVRSNTAEDRPQLVIAPFYLGHALSKNLTCIVEVRDMGSIGSPIATGRCNEPIDVKPGTYEVSTVVSGGGNARFALKSSQRVDKGLHRVAQSDSFGLARLLLKRKPTAPGTTAEECRFSAVSDGAITPVTASEQVMVLAGNYTLRFACGTAGEQAMGTVDLAVGRDVTLQVEVSNGKAVVSAAAPEAAPAGPTALPGAPDPGVRPDALQGEGIPAVKGPDLPLPGTATTPTPGADAPLTGTEVAPPNYADPKPTPVEQKDP